MNVECHSLTCRDVIASEIEIPSEKQVGATCEAPLNFRRVLSKLNSDSFTRFPHQQPAQPMPMNSQRKLFAVVPAAGRSRRMGRPKLMLPLGTKTVIACLIDVLNRPEISETFIVVRPDDVELRAEVEANAATVIQPTSPPPDMRDSVEIAVSEIRRRYTPSPDDGWLLVPADHPTLDPNVLDELQQRWNQDDCQILVPAFNERRGHPTLFRWRFADEIAAIPPDRGLNWLLQQHADDVTELSVDRPSVITDLDTPHDYERLLREWRQR